MYYVMNLEDTTLRPCFLPICFNAAC